MERLFVSEGNPAPPPSVYRRATQAILVAETRASTRLRTNCNLHIPRPKFTLTMIALHTIHVIMVYFYVRTIAHPLPRGAINHTFRGLTAFTVFTYILGYVVGCVEAVLIVATLRTLAGIQRVSSNCCTFFLIWILLWAVGITVVLLFGMAGLVFSQVALVPAFRHACRDDWITVLLDGPNYRHRDTPYRATFSLSETSEPLFTFTSQDPDRWRFNLMTLGSASPSVLPALRNITYDDPRLAVSALCYGDNTTAPCATGRYDPIAYLSFDVTVNGIRSRIRSPYREWSLDDVLSVSLRNVGDDGSLSPLRVLQTSPRKPGNCRQLKVCIAHPQSPSSVLGADILVAVGWLLGVQGEAAAKCTKPRRSSSI